MGSSPSRRINFGTGGGWLCVCVGGCYGCLSCRLWTIVIVLCEVLWIDHGPTMHTMGIWYICLRCAHIISTLPPHHTQRNAYREKQERHRGKKVDPFCVIILLGYLRLCGCVWG